MSKDACPCPDAGSHSGGFATFRIAGRYLLLCGSHARRRLSGNG